MKGGLFLLVIGVAVMICSMAGYAGGGTQGVNILLTLIFS